MTPGRVLVVDDTELNRRLLTRLLQGIGHETEEATDGVEALARLRRDERTASIPVLALTAQAMSGDRERFLEVGFDGYLSKPVDVAELIQAVRENCDRG